MIEPDPGKYQVIYSGTAVCPVTEAILPRHKLLSGCQILPLGSDLVLFEVDRKLYDDMARSHTKNLKYEMSIFLSYIDLFQKMPTD